MTVQFFKTFALAALTAATALLGSANAEDKKPAIKIDSDMIVGGITADANKWPWQVHILMALGEGQPVFHCGGSLIQSQWVLTAAHCLYDSSGLRHTLFKIGYGHNKLDQQKQVVFEKAIPHPDYAPGINAYDIALIKLAEPVEIGEGVAAVTLAGDEGFIQSIGKMATVTGWGTMIDANAFHDKYGNDMELPVDILQPNDLQEVQIPIQKFDQCRVNYFKGSGGETTIAESQFCAGLKIGGKDACQGDSGGPLVFPSAKTKNGFVQIGVVSWGAGCAQPKLFGVYTRVDYFLKWIKETVAAN